MTNNESTGARPFQPSKPAASTTHERGEAMIQQAPSRECPLPTRTRTIRTPTRPINHPTARGAVHLHYSESSGARRADAVGDRRAKARGDLLGLLHFLPRKAKPLVAPITSVFRSVPPEQEETSRIAIVLHPSGRVNQQQPGRSVRQARTVTPRPACPLTVTVAGAPCLSCNTSR